MGKPYAFIKFLPDFKKSLSRFRAISVNIEQNICIKRENAFSPKLLKFLFTRLIVSRELISHKDSVLES
jgi:hypothetical protein